MSSSTKLPPFDPSTLKHWLTRHLEPICDAEPAVLADYILALLKHDVSLEELRKLCVSQLEDFLDKHTESFVDSLLSHLASPAPSSSSRPAPPANAPSGPSKRSANDAFPPSGPSGAAKTARRSSMGGETAAATRRGEEVEMRDGAAAAGRNGPAGRELQPCRDYHFRGFCARGDSCPFAHDQIPPNHPSLTSLQQQHPSSSSSGANQPPSFPPGAGMALGPNGIPFPFFAAAAAAQAQAAAQGLPNPFGPGGPGRGGGPFFPGGGAGGPGPQFSGAGGRGNFPPPGPSGPGQGAFPPRYGQHPGQGGQGGRGSRQPRRNSHGGGGGGPATAPAKTSRLVLVENVPAQHLTEQSVRHFFSAFGTILGLRIIPPVGREGGEEEGDVTMKDGAGGGGGRNRDGEKGKAEVFYTHPAAADRAVRSEQAVFGNRFVRVYRVVEEASPLSQGAPPLGGGPGGEGMQVEDDFVAPPPQPALNPQAAAFSFGGAPGAPPGTFPPRPPRSFNKPRPPHPAAAKNDPNSPSALAARLSAITAKQKTLFAELETLSSSSGEVEKQRKKAILGVLRTLEKEAGEVKGKLEEGAAKQKDAAAAAGEGAEGAEAGEEGEAEDPREHLRRLQAEATRMGLDPSTGQPSHPYPPRKFAPRPSRGRGGFKGNPNSFRLDNRSTAVVVSGRFEGGEEDVRRVREYFEKFGPLTDVSSISPAPTTSSTDGKEKQELTVKFSTRHDAEKALASGTLLSLSSLPYSSSAPFSLRWAGTTQPSSSHASSSSSSFPSSGAVNGEVKMEEDGGVKQEDGSYGGGMEEEGTREDRRERDEY